MKISIFIIRSFFLLFWVLLSPNTVSANALKKPCVLVSVAPHKFFVEKIAGTTLDVWLMVPAGASAHTYEPTARHILAASKGEIWFCIGEAFEARAIRALQSHQPALRPIDMRKGVALIHADHEVGRSCCCQGGDDLHFWLSTRQAQIQAQTIADALIQAYPEHAFLYQANVKNFQKELEDLDHEIEMILKPLKNRNILVSHPAYAYFCRDYDLQQHSIEMEGKDPTPQQMTRLLNRMQQLQIQTIYIQMQYNNKAAKLVAEAIGAKISVLDPYSEDYMNCVKEIAHAFASG